MTDRKPNPSVLAAFESSHGREDDASERLERCLGWLQRFEGLEVLVVGDVMIDEDLVGDVSRVSPEAPVPVVSVGLESRTLGGAGNVVRNLVALGARCRFCTVVGDDEDGRLVVDLLKALGVETAGVVLDPSRRTTRKTRIVARGQQMIRADREDLHPVAGDARTALEAGVRAAARGADGLALVDYGKGVLAPDLARAFVAIAQSLGRPVAVDPKGHLRAYAGASLLKPNRAEALDLLALREQDEGQTTHTGAAAAAVNGTATEDTPAIDLSRALAAILPGVDVALTLGAGGMVIQAAGAEPEVIPTAAMDVYDVQGAGDTSLAAFWLARLAGASMGESARIAHAASGVAVSKVGTATATRDEVCLHLPKVIAAGVEDV